MLSKYFGAMLGLLCAAPLSARAQNASVLNAGLPASLLAEPAVGLQMVRVSNMPPDVIAWWIDPEHNPEAPLYAKSRRTLHDNALDEAAADRVAAEASMEVARLVAARMPGQKTPLRAGEWITPIDSQNAVVVRGANAERVQEIADIIASLDRPFGQVEVETQFVEVDEVALRRFGAPPAEAGKTNQVRFVGDFRRTLQQMIEAKHATIIMAPKVTAINKLAAGVSKFVTTPTYAKLEDYLQPPQAPLVFVNSRLGSVVLPTINTDDTISLIVHAMNTRWLNAVAPANNKPTRINYNPPIYFDTPGQISVEARLADGETLVVSGPSTDFWRVQGYAESMKAPTKPMLLFITPLIVRPRHEVAIPVPGT